MISKILGISFLVFFIYTVSTTVTSCAIISPPTGGKADSLAPKIVKVNPENGALNVRSKTIVLEFDEYVQLEDASSKIQISPLPTIAPDITSKLRTVTIKLKDSLQQNTTYSIAINGAIKDVNEGNKLKDLAYTFSTGIVIDSNTISGKVLLAETGKIDSTLLVALYTNQTDSAVAKERPRFITNLDSNGRFTFKNLPSKEFNIFAFADEGGQKKYTSPKQLFAYNDSVVNSKNNPTGITLYAYVEEVDVPKPPVERASAADLKIRFGNTLNNGQQDVLKDLSLFANKKIAKIDTTKLTLTDTTYTIQHNKKVTVDSLKKNITIQTKWTLEQHYRLVIEKEFATDDKGVIMVKNDTIKFVTKAAKDYGKVILRFNNLELGKKPVLQILQGNNLISSYPLTTLKLTIPALVPGEYDMRILYDENNNGKWDHGTYFGKRKQPEKTTQIKTKLEVKSDWDNELEVEDKL
jgi:hypothetical protein